MRKAILSFGEVLWDILPSETILGGAPFNFAYRVNSLGDMGLMISRLGRDELGQKAFSRVAELGLDTTYLQWDDEKPTGTVPVSFDEDMRPDFVITPDVAYDYMELTDEIIEVAAAVDCLCFGTLIQRSKKSRETLAAIVENSPKSLKILDINLRRDCYGEDTVISSLGQADVLKLNEEEIVEVAGMLGLSGSTVPEYCRDVLHKWSLQYCLVTLGDKGVFAVSDNGDRIHISGHKVELADSVGSGDAFTAGFAHKILQGETLSDACRFGNAMGAIVATQSGATGAVPSEKIECFMREKHERVAHPDFESYDIT
ncbi:MAG: carbohydrate kinase [Phycisphaerales bacterium]|nr:MAG: carbohydrate kinase [Phycisphaerales bacterium]